MTDSTNNADVGSTAQTVQGNAGAGAGNVGYGAQAGTGGASAGTTNVSRDDILSAISTAVQDASRAYQQTENVIDIGGDEAQMRGVVNDSHKWSSNDKRTYDAYQDIELEHARSNAEYRNRSRDHYDAMQSDNRAHIANLRKIELELLQNGNTAAKVGDSELWSVSKVALNDALATAVSKALQNAGIVPK